MNEMVVCARHRPGGPYIIAADACRPSLKTLVTAPER